MKNYNRQTTGFTMVELLVTISIIAILSAIVYASFGQARASARDDIRQSSLKEVQLAIEFFKAQNGRYPNMGCVPSAGDWAGPGDNTGMGCTTEAYIGELMPEYIQNLPRDPISENVLNSGFLYQSDGDDYKLMVHNSVEVKTVTSDDHKFARCPDFATCGGTPSDRERTYAVYSPGAADW